MLGAEAGLPEERTQVHHVVPLVERQQALIEELRCCAPQPVPGSVLARRLGVTGRTVERDVARLVAAGVPITVRRGPGGGYMFNAPAQLPPLDFSPAEAAALIASLVAVGPYSSATAQAALAKLVDSLTPRE